jgi:hypothetical protein
VHCLPISVQLSRDAPRLAQHFFATFPVRRQADHEPLGYAQAAAAFALEELQLFALPALIARDLTQGQFAQGGKIAGLEEVLERLLDLFGRIDFPLAETLAKFSHRDVN